MAKQGLSIYVSDIPGAREIPEWHKRFTFVKVSSIEHLKQLQNSYFNDGCPTISLDTETSSLSIADLQIVGLSFCWNITKSKTAYYVPLGHKIGNENLSIPETLAIIDEMLRASERVLMYNAPFDMRVLRKYGINTWGYKVFDVMALVWNCDSNVKKINLKLMSLYHVGFRMVTYKELIKKLQNGQEFALTSEDLDAPDDEDEDGSLDFFPCTQDVVEYAGSDVICTNFLFIRFEKFYNENKFINDMDSHLIDVKMYLEETSVMFDRNKAKELFDRESKRKKEIEKRIYRLAGNVPEEDLVSEGKIFDILSPKQLVEIFKGMKIHLSEKTEKGNISLNAAVLGKLAEKYEIAKLIIEYRELNTALSTYIKKFTEDESGFFKYSAFTNPTGRLQGSGKEKKGYGTPVFMPLNIQNITKPEPGYWIPTKLEKVTDGLLGYDFKSVSEGSDETVEGFEPGNIREIFMPREGHIVLSADYSGQEIVAVANLSKDPAFLEPLKRGESIHKRTAIDMFGKENYNNKTKKIAKAANFNCLYLGNEYSMFTNLSKDPKLEPMPMEELKVYYEKWRDLHKVYFDWLETRYKQARMDGYIKSILGRVRRVAHWFNSPNWQDNFHAKKTVANSPIQGGCGDIMRLVLIRCFNEVILNPEWEGKVFFMMSVHDEVNYSIDRRPEYFYPIANKILEIMVDMPFEWEVPLSVGISVGENWGALMPFSIDKDGTWVPKIG